MRPAPIPPASGPGPGPLDVLWQAGTLIWVILAGEGLAAVLSLGPGVYGNRWVYFGLASLIVQWIAFLSLGTLYLVRRRLRRLRPTRVLQVSLVLLLGSTALVVGALWWLLREILPSTDADWRALLFRIGAIVLIVGLLGAAALQNHWRAQQMAVRAKQWELESLRARIRPHFLFNTLNSGVALARQRPEQVEQLLLALSDLFRAALANPHDIPLEDELALVRRYLEIEQVRFGPRLRVDWQVPETLPGARVPALSVQPLVENAVRHGIERLPDGGVVGIEVGADDGMAVLRVRNRVAPGNGGTEGHALGLRATQERVDAITAGRGGLRTLRDGDDYVVEMRVPLDAGA